MWELGSLIGSKNLLQPIETPFLLEFLKLCIHTNCMKFLNLLESFEQKIILANKSQHCNRFEIILLCDCDHIAINF